jgi:hypothetical protein
VVVHASGCASLLVYFLPHGVGVEVSRQLGQKPARSVRFTGVGLFVPKPTHRDCGLCLSASDLWRIVRQRPLASAAGDSRSYSLRYSALEPACDPLLANARRVSDAVAHLGLRPSRVRQDRLASDPLWSWLVVSSHCADASMHLLALGPHGRQDGFMPEQPSLLYSPEHQQAIGRVVLAASGMEAAVATILARLWDPPEQAIRKVAGRPARWQLDELRRHVKWMLPGLLRDEILAWMERVEQEAWRRNRIVHATWYRVDKPEPGSVAFAHYGKQAARDGHAVLEQVSLSDLQVMGMVIDSVAATGLILLGKVESYLAGDLPALFIDGPPPPPPSGN